MPDYDVCIVGSGAGGGIAAYALARRDIKVLVLEKGPRATEADFGDDELRLGERRMLDQDPLIEPRTFRNDKSDPDHLYVGRVLGVSQCVGGGSVHYGAVCFRFRKADFRARSTWGHLPGASITDWPLADFEVPDDITIESGIDPVDSESRPTIWNYYRRVEKLIGVAGGDLTTGIPDTNAEWRPVGDPYPMKGHPPNYGAHLFEKGAGKLGLHPFPTPVAINNGQYTFTDPDDSNLSVTRNGCSYCGFCSSHGCPIGAKGDTRVTALALAEATGNCTVLANCKVVEVKAAGGAVTGIDYLDENGDLQNVTATRYVLAASTVDTPRLVLMSPSLLPYVNEDLVGRYLQVHHFPGAIGFFSERIDYYRGFWSMRCLDDLYMGPDPYSKTPDTWRFGFGNIQTVGPSSGYPITAGGIISTAKTVGWGRNHKQAMRSVFGHAQWIGLVGQDPGVYGNRVDLDPTVADIDGLPSARITYRHHPNDYVVAAAALPFLEALLFAMGAESVKSSQRPQGLVPIVATTGVPQFGELTGGPSEGGGHQRGPGRGFPDPIGGLVNHQMGTMRMGNVDGESVVDARGKVWGVENLYVADASVFPTSGGYNPTLTIQAMAWRTADRIFEDLTS